MRFIVGVDLGQSRDFTAIVVAERRPAPTGRRLSDWRERGLDVAEEYAEHYAIRHIERPPLHTPYPEIVERVKAIVTRPEFVDDTDLVVDQTGVGRPVIDAMRYADLNPRPVTITGGDAEATDKETGGWRVPKRVLVSRMQLVLQERRLHVADSLALAETFVREMDAFKVKITANARDTYEAGGWREGAHDDLVMAAGLALWWGERTPTLHWWASSRQPAPDTPEAALLSEERMRRLRLSEMEERRREERERRTDEGQEW